jgi:hypothetical protein
MPTYAVGFFQVSEKRTLRGKKSARTLIKSAASSVLPLTDSRMSFERHVGKVDL